MITVLVEVDSDAASIEAMKPAIAKMEAASRAEAATTNVCKVSRDLCSSESDTEARKFIATMINRFPENFDSPMTNILESKSLSGTFS